MKISVVKINGLVVFVIMLALFSTPAFSQDTAALRTAVTVEGIRNHQLVLQSLADDNLGNRSTGTTGYEQSVYYIANQLFDSGYDVVMQPFSFHTWYATGPSALEQTLPVSLSYVEGVDYSLAVETSSGSATAFVKQVDLNIGNPESTSGCEIEDFAGFIPGEIALIRRGSCFFQQKAENASAAGAVGVIIMNQGNSPERMGLLNGTLTQDYSGGIPVLFTTYDRGIEWASKPGLKIHMHADVFRGDATTYNIIAENSGGNPNRVILAGAALDSPHTGPGINGNGSSVATILEIALQMSKLGIETDNKVRFAFWGAWYDGLLGSSYYASTLSESEQNAIEMVLSFEALGSPNYVRFVYDGDGSEGGAVGGEGSGDIEATLHSYFADLSLGGGLATEPYNFSGSDAISFAALDLPVGGLFGGQLNIKTSEQAVIYGGTAGEQYDPCAHLACDTFDNVSLNGLDEMSDAAAHVILTYGASTSSLRASAVQNLVSEVDTLNISSGIENGLLSKLSAAIHSIDEGSDEAASHQLQAFINQVEAKRGSQLTDAEADALIAIAQGIIDDLI